MKILSFFKTHKIEKNLIKYIRYILYSEYFFINMKILYFDIKIVGGLYKWASFIQTLWHSG